MTTLQPAPTPNPVLVQETLSPQLSTLNSSTTLPACRETFSPPAAPQLIDTKPVLTPPQQARKSRRTGRVASLPKTNRDMVNRMIHNGVPYKNIVGALDELGFTVTERNISNWATGGFLEWRAEQDLVLQNRLDQDHLLDHLRRDDASELPEVGLQAAATRLSQILLQKTARAEDVEANLGTFSQMVDILSRLNREITTLQKQRDDSRRSLGRAYDPARVKNCDQESAVDMERSYSDPSPDSGLSKPEVPPLLPPPSTSEFLAQTDREDAEQRQLESMVRLKATMQALAGQTKNDSRVAQASLPAGSPSVPLGKSLPAPHRPCPKSLPEQVGSRQA